jgi:hypothetical protein
MSLLPPAVEPESYMPVGSPAIEAPDAPQAGVCSSDRFVTQQILRLVRQLFIPGWPRPARHVVFSAVDAATYTAEMCMDVGKALCAQVPGSVCVVESNLQNPQLEEIYYRRDHPPDRVPEDHGLLHGLCQHVSGRLWIAPSKVLAGDGRNFSAAWLERRLLELHFEFDYTVLHGPPARAGSEAVLLGRLCDGVALVVEAHQTRRATAHKAKEVLQAANVRLLGTVLTERTFPIPEGIYRRL